MTYFKDKATQVVFLAGGEGTRLRPITNTTTKVMIEVNGKPFLEHQFNYLKKFGFRKFLILVCHLGKQVEDYFGSGDKFEITIDYSYEKEPMGTGGALKLACDKLENSFIVINGDTFYPLDYNDFLNKVSHIKQGGVIVVYDNAEKIAPNNITVENDLTISRYTKKVSLAEMNGLDGGVSFLSKQVLSLIPEGKKSSLEEEVFPILIEQKELKAYLCNVRFYDIGTFERLDLIRNVIK